MKRYILLLMLGILFGCDSLFDDEVPPHNVVGEAVIVNETSAEIALNGVYSYLGNEGSLTSYTIVDNEYRLGLLTGTNRGKFDQEELIPMKYTNENLYVRAPWEECYKIINAANNFIYYTNLVDSSKFGSGRKTQLLGEARFMRAWSYMNLLRRYGYFWDTESPYGLILRLEPSTLSNNSMGRSGVADTYAAIIEDLDYAIANAPDHYSKFRACRNLAKAYKASLLLDRGLEGDAAEALKLAEEVIASNEFSLEKSYADVFKNKYKSSELMFSRHLNEPPSLTDNVPSILKMFGDGVYKPTELYLSHFPETDVRYNVTFDSIMPQEQQGRPVSKKKKLIWNKHFAGDDNSPMYYMRLPQLYYVKAEAMLETGAPIEDAVAVLSSLEVKRGNPALDPHAYADRSDVKKLVFELALREFGTENGELFFMAVRMKLAGQRLISEYNRYFESDKQLCFPIPKDEIEHNFVVKQNPL